MPEVWLQGLERFMKTAVGQYSVVQSSAGREQELRLRGGAEIVAARPSPPVVGRFERMGFLPYQAEWLRDESRFKPGLWARQTGKDYTCAAEAVLDCVQNLKSHWLILACGERQACESLEKAREWSHTFVNDPKAQQNSSSPVKISRQSKTEIRFSNGSRITALPAKPGTVRGYSANLILTEFAFHDDPEAIWKAIFPSVTNELRGGPKK